MWNSKVNQTSTVAPYSSCLLGASSCMLLSVKKKYIQRVTVSVTSLSEDTAVIFIDTELRDVVVYGGKTCGVFTKNLAKSIGQEISHDELHEYRDHFLVLDRGGKPPAEPLGSLYTNFWQKLGVQAEPAQIAETSPTSSSFPTSTSNSTSSPALTPGSPSLSSDAARLFTYVTNRSSSDSFISTSASAFDHWLLQGEGQQFDGNLLSDNSSVYLLACPGQLAFLWIGLEVKAEERPAIKDSAKFFVTDVLWPSSSSSSSASPPPPPPPRTFSSSPSGGRSTSSGPILLSGSTLYPLLTAIEPTRTKSAEKVVLFHQRWHQFGSKSAGDVGIGNGLNAASTSAATAAKGISMKSIKSEVDRMLTINVGSRKMVAEGTDSAMSGHTMPFRLLDDDESATVNMWRVQQLTDNTSSSTSMSSTPSLSLCSPSGNIRNPASPALKSPTSGAKGNEMGFEEVTPDQHALGVLGSTDALALLFTCKNGSRRAMYVWIGSECSNSRKTFASLGATQLDSYADMINLTEGSEPPFLRMAMTNRLTPLVIIRGTTSINMADRTLKNGLRALNGFGGEDDDEVDVRGGGESSAGGDGGGGGGDRRYFAVEGSQLDSKMTSSAIVIVEQHLASLKQHGLCPYKCYISADVVVPAVTSSSLSSSSSSGKPTAIKFVVWCGPNTDTTLQQLTKACCNDNSGGGGGIDGRLAHALAKQTSCADVNVLQTPTTTMQIVADQEKFLSGMKQAMVGGAAMEGLHRPVSLYLVSATTRKTGAMFVREIGAGDVFTQADLLRHESFVLDSGRDLVFVWHGNKQTAEGMQLTKEVAEQFIEDMPLEQRGRLLSSGGNNKSLVPLQVVEVFSGEEPSAFVWCFRYWNQSKMPKFNHSAARQLPLQPPQKTPTTTSTTDNNSSNSNCRLPPPSPSCHQASPSSSHSKGTFSFSANQQQPPAARGKGSLLAGTPPPIVIKTATTTPTTGNSATSSPFRAAQALQLSPSSGSPSTASAAAALASTASAAAAAYDELGEPIRAKKGSPSLSRQAIQASPAGNNDPVRTCSAPAKPNNDVATSTLPIRTDGSQSVIAGMPPTANAPAAPLPSSGPGPASSAYDEFGEPIKRAHTRKIGGSNSSSGSEGGSDAGDGGSAVGGAAAAKASISHRSQPSTLTATSTPASTSSGYDENGEPIKRTDNRSTKFGGGSGSNGIGHKITGSGVVRASVALRSQSSSSSSPSSTTTPTSTSSSTSTSSAYDENGEPIRRPNNRSAKVDGNSRDGSASGGGSGSVTATMAKRSQSSGSASSKPSSIPTSTSSSTSTSNRVPAIIASSSSTQPLPPSSPRSAQVEDENGATDGLSAIAKLRAKFGGGESAPAKPNFGRAL